MACPPKTKKRVKKFFNRLMKITKHLPKPWQVVLRDFYFMRKKMNNLERLVALLLQQKYKSIAENQGLDLINKSEFRICSQNGEDGILLYLFSKIGTTNRRFVELGIGDGRECNTANLSINFGWHGLLIDGNKDYVNLAKYYYQERLDAKSPNVRIIPCFVTVENINKVLVDNGIEGEIDLLSIDIDGNDYWVWKAITVINPRVVVIEYNASLGYKKSMTVKYDPKFNILKKHPSGLYHGASLTALTKLARSKGYILVGCESAGINAFFVRKDAAQGKLTGASVKEAYFPDSSRLKVLSASEQFEHIKHLDFDYV